MVVIGGADGGGGEPDGPDSGQGGARQQQGKLLVLVHSDAAVSQVLVFRIRT